MGSSEGPSNRNGTDGPSGSGWSGVLRNEMVSWPVRQQVYEAIEIEKRKDKLVISGIKESDDAEEKVGEILQEMGYQKTFQVVERVGKVGGYRKGQGQIGQG